MEQLGSFKVEGEKHKVHRLVKSLYRLKQTFKQWHEKFNNIMIIRNGFIIDEYGKFVEEIRKSMRFGESIYR